MPDHISYFQRILRFFTKLDTSFLLFSIVCVLYVYQELYWYLAAGRDDTYITIWSAYGLAKGAGFVNYNMQPTEVSSSFLHVLLVAVFWLISPIDVFLVNKIFGMLCGFLTLLLIYKSADIFFPHIKKLRHYASVATTLLLTSSVVWMYWTVGGLENALVAFLIVCLMRVALADWQSNRCQSLGLGVCTSLLVLSRSEGFLYIVFLALYAIAWYLFKRSHVRQLVFALLIPTVTQASLFAWRWHTFGALFPNPTYAKVKVANAAIQIASGWKYLVGFYRDAPFHTYMLVALVFVALSIAISSTRKQHSNSSIPKSYAVLLAVILLNHSFVILVGKDWMELYRFIQPVVPIIAIVVVGWLAWLVENTPLLRARDSYSVVQLSGMSIFLMSFMWQFFKQKGFHWQSILNTSLLLPVSLLVVLVLWQLVRDRDARGVYASMIVVACVCYGLIVPANMQYIRTNQSVCGKPIDPRSLSTLDSTRIMQELHAMNCAQARDNTFLREYLAQYYVRFAAQHNNKVVLRSGQGGYIPFYLKTQYPEIELFFIDDFGLNDAYVARLKQKIPNYDSSEEFHAYLDAHGVNMWYRLAMKKQRLDKLLRENPKWKVAVQSSEGIILIQR